MNMPIPNDQSWSTIDESSTAPIEPPVILVDGIKVTSNVYEWYNHETDKTTNLEPSTVFSPDLFTTIPNTSKPITITIQSNVMPFRIYLQQYKDADTSRDMPIDPFYEEFSPQESLSRITQDDQTFSFTIDPKPGKKYFTVSPVYFNYNFFENPDGDAPQQSTANYLFKFE